MIMEDDFRFNAGTGSCLREDGSVQNDSSVATSDGRMGAIANLRNFKNPVLIAKELLDEFPVMLAGEGAIEFALNKGYKQTKVKGSEKGWTGDTVGAVVQSSKDDIVVASSTGGVRALTSTKMLHENTGRESEYELSVPHRVPSCVHDHVCDWASMPYASAYCILLIN